MFSWLSIRKACRSESAQYPDPARWILLLQTGTMIMVADPLVHKHETKQQGGVSQAMGCPPRPSKKGSS